MAVLLVGPFMAQADATIASVATPSIRTNLGASGAALELVIGGYLIAFSVLLITGARLGQTHGYRRVFLAGIATFGLASLACGLAPNSRYLPADERRAANRLDLTGVATLTASAVLVVLPLVLGRIEGWPVWTWLCLGAAGPAFVLFLATQRSVAA